MATKQNTDDQKSLIGTAAFVGAAALCDVMFPRLGIAMSVLAALVLLGYWLEARGITPEESSHWFTRAMNLRVFRVTWLWVTLAFGLVGALNLASLFGYNLPLAGHWLTTGLLPRFEGFAAIGLMLLTPVPANKAVKEYNAQWGRFRHLDEAISLVFSLGKDDLQPRHIHMMQNDVEDTVYSIEPVPGKMKAHIAKALTVGFDDLNLALGAQLPNFQISEFSTTEAVLLVRVRPEEEARRIAHQASGGTLGGHLAPSVNTLIIPAMEGVTPELSAPMPEEPMRIDVEDLWLRMAGSLPVGGRLDLSDPAIRNQIESKVSERHGPFVIPMLDPRLRPTQDGHRSVELVDYFPGAHAVPIAVKPTAELVGKWAVDAAAQGRDLVSVDEHRRGLVTAVLEPRVKDLRELWARELGCQPHELVLAASNSMIIVLSAPKTDFSEKRQEVWQRRVNAHMRRRVGQKWVAVEARSQGRMYLIRAEDKLAQVQPYPWDAPVDLEHLPFGIDEEGRPVSLGLLELNQLLGGTPGGGKSGGLTALMCGVARLENVAMIGLDPKRVEQAEWGCRFSRIAKDEDCATDVLERMVEEMERRYLWLEGQPGRKKFTPDILNSQRPLLVLVIDELAELVSVASDPDDVKAEKARSTMIRRLIAKGRAAGIVVISATQKPQSDVIPTSLRDLIQLRIAYATTNSDMTDTILGKGMSQLGGESHAITAKERGVCYVIKEGSRTPSRMRTYWVPDKEIADIAAKYAYLRVDLPWLTDNVAPAPRRDSWRRSEPITHEPVPEPVVVTEHVLGGFTLDDLLSATTESAAAPHTEEGVDEFARPEIPPSTYEE